MAKKKGMGKGFTPIKNASSIGAGNPFKAVKNERGETIYVDSILKQRGQDPPTKMTTPQTEQKPVEQKKEAPKTEILKPQTPQQQQQKQPPPVTPVIQTKSVAQKMDAELKSITPKYKTEKAVLPTIQTKSIAQKMDSELKVKPLVKQVQKTVKPPTIKR